MHFNRKNRVIFFLYFWCSNSCIVLCNRTNNIKNKRPREFSLFPRVHYSIKLKFILSKKKKQLPLHKGVSFAASHYGSL